MAVNRPSSRYRPRGAVRAAKWLRWVSLVAGGVFLCGAIAVGTQVIGTEYSPGWSSVRAAGVGIGQDRAAVVGLLGDPLYMQRPVSTLTLAMPDGSSFLFGLSSDDPLDDEPVCQSISPRVDECDRGGWISFEHPMRAFLGWSRRDLERFVGATNWRDASPDPHELWYYSRPINGGFGLERVYVFDTRTGLVTADTCDFRYRD